MLGLIWAFISGIAVTKYKVEEGIDNYEKRTESLRKGETYWYKNDGCARLHSNGHRVMTIHLDNHDFVLKDIDKHIVLRNYTLEKAERFVEQQKEWAKEEGKSTYCCWYDRFSRAGDLYKKYCDKGIAGSRFKDFKTGEIYIIRKFSSYENPYGVDLYYYINIDTLEAVRPIDKDLNKIKNKSILSLEEFIEKNRNEFIRRSRFKPSEEMVNSYLEGIDKVYEKMMNINSHVKNKIVGMYNEICNMAEYQEMVHREDEVNFSRYDDIIK